MTDVTNKQVKAVQQNISKDVYDVLAAHIMPEPYFNAMHHVLLKAVFTFMDYGIFSITTDMLLQAVTTLNGGKATGLQREEIDKYMSDMQRNGYHIEKSFDRQAENSIAVEAPILMVRKYIEKERTTYVVEDDNTLYRFYQRLRMRENGMQCSVPQNNVKRIK